jgi:hypothetical protein
MRSTWNFSEILLCRKQIQSWTAFLRIWMIAKTFDNNSSNESEKTRMHFRRTHRVSISMSISDMTTINQNIQDTEMIETNHWDIRHTLNHSATIRFMMTIESINLEIFSSIIRTIRMTQTRLILILILSIQNSSQVRMMLTELRNLLSI